MKYFGSVITSDGRSNPYTKSRITQRIKKKRYCEKETTIGTKKKMNPSILSSNLSFSMDVKYEPSTKR